jgi:hypothetical protein
MNMINNRPLSLLVSALVINGLFTSTILAEPIYHPSGPQLTFGGMTHRQLSVSDMGNPANPASLNYPEGDSGIYGAGLSIGLGIEYDGNDNFFELLNALGRNDAITPGDGGVSDGTPEEGEDATNDLAAIIGAIVGTPTPAQEAELQALINEVAEKAGTAAVFLTVALTGLHAKAFASADIPVLISRDDIGAWTFGANVSITTRLAGLNDPITFDSDAALTALEQVYNLDPTDPITDYDLSGGTFVTVDPATGDATFRFENNSAVSTKAAQITEFSIGYSREVWQKDDNKVYVGIEPKFYDVGLSNTAVAISNIENARDIFEALDSSNFSYSQDVGLDLGAIWSGKQYQVGATLTNINEPDFQFPANDITGFTNPAIIALIRENEIYVMERQLKLEGGYITSSGAWGINFGLDANPIPDPMGDDYQWASVGAGFASDSWWLPGARLGLRKNLAGTQLTYVTGGITVFNIVNLDLAATTETIQVNGDTIPRGLIGNIGVYVQF